MLARFDVRANVRAVERDLDDLQRKQIPFAAAVGINMTADQVVEAETAALEDVFQDPTTFTKRAFRKAGATKARPEARVFALPTQAAYLTPAEDNEPQFLGKGKRIRTPVNIGVSAGGNIAKSKLKTVLARKDVFVGHVKGVGGVWQRLPSKGKGRKGARDGQRLRLLVAFTRPVHIAPRLEYHERAARIVDANATANVRNALLMAFKTAR